MKIVFLKDKCFFLKGQKVFYSFSEAVVNALAHRDYRSTANVQVYIFKDRVEIVSPGGLPAGMTEADLGFKSIPVIAIRSCSGCCTAWRRLSILVQESGASVIYAAIMGLPNPRLRCRSTGLPLRFRDQGVELKANSQSLPLM